MSGTFLLRLVHAILTSHITPETGFPLRLQQRRNVIELVKYTFCAHVVNKGEGTFCLARHAVEADCDALLNVSFIITRRASCLEVNDVTR